MIDIKKQIGSKINLPQGYHIEFGGEFKEQQQSFRELLLILFTSALLVFTTILFLFKKIRISFLILFLSLLGVAGGLFALLLTNTALNVGSYTGIIMIIGIIAENSIFTIRQFNTNLTSQNVENAIVDAVSTRLRPNLMTALGAIVALFPIALGIGTGAQLNQPLAIAVIGGFIIAIPLLLFVLPTLIKMVYKNEAHK